MNTAPCILSVAFPYAPVGPAAVGGAEVILSQLEAALPALGFTSVVVGNAASRPCGQLYPVHVPPGEITDAVRVTTQLAVQDAIDRALALHPVALVHMHGMDFDRFTLPPDLPVVVTLHLPLSWCSDKLWDVPSNFHFVCVSEAQRRTCPPAMQHRVLVIENGVPLPDASLLRPHGSYALMLARICAEKNIATGLDAARLAGLPAVLAGEVFPYPDHLRYFADEIAPRLTEQGKAHTQREAEGQVPAARFLGPVTGHAKTRLLTRAACLLLPSLAPETSSLVAMEALAAGLPVIAMASGAVPDIIEEGRTGFLLPPGSGLDAAQAMADTVRRLPEIDRTLCRTQAEKRFSLERMIARYAELWRRLALPYPSAIPSPLDQPLPQVQQDQISIEHLTDSVALESLLPAWTALWHKDPNASPFQHPAWLLPWWHQFGPEGQLQALALRERNAQELIAFLPLYTYTPATDARGQRQLLLIGAGTSDYLDGLWSPRAPDAPASALRFASDFLQAWDTACLTQIAAGTALLKAAGEAGLPIGSAEPVSVIDLSRPLPSKLRANAGRYRRHAEALGTLQLHLAGSASEALQNFELLLAFHRDRWKGEEGGVLADPRVQAHHRESIPRLHGAGLLRFFRLTLASNTIGVLYALADPEDRANRRLSLYLIGFKRDLAALSPGTLLLHSVWNYAREAGFQKLDLLRGGEAYKQLWGAAEEPTFAISLPPAQSSGA